MCQGIFHLLTLHFPDDDVSLLTIGDLHSAASAARYDVVVLNCESIEHASANLFPVRALSEMKAPVLGIATSCVLFNRLSHELPMLRGIIDQQSNIEFLVSAIRVIVAGGYCYSWNILASDSDCEEERFAKAGLTRREREILKLCQSGESNKAISLRLSRSEKTISAHKSNILRKLGINSEQLNHGSPSLHINAGK